MICKLTALLEYLDLRFTAYKIYFTLKIKHINGVIFMVFADDLSAIKKLVNKIYYLALPRVIGIETGFILDHLYNFIHEILINDLSMKYTCPEKFGYAVFY